MNPNIEPKTCNLGTEKELLNFDGLFVAQEKFDGHRCIMYCKGGKNYFYSRRTSDVTYEKEDNTERLPYLHNFALPFEDSIFDGELIANWTDTDSTQVQHLLGSTPERAKEMWEQGYTLTFKIFDVIRFKGEDVTQKPLIERLNLLTKLEEHLNAVQGLGNFIQVVLTSVDDFTQKTLREVPDKGARQFMDNCAKVADYKKLLQTSLENGGEGIILKRLDSPYDFKRNKAWVKYKSVKTADLVIMGFVSPKKSYTGKFNKEELKNLGWKYWENGEPVSKTYSKGWVAGIKLGAYKNDKLSYVCTVKGISDKTQEELLNNDYCNVVVEVKYQNIQNEKTKSLRHPRFNCFRFDKNAEQCLWENIGQ